MAKPNFNKWLTDFAKYMDWEIEEMDEEGVWFTLEAESGNEIELLISHEEEIVYFDMPSEMNYTSEQAVPDSASTLLLKRNALLPVGGWCLDEYEEGWCFSLKWSLDLETLVLMTQQNLEGLLNALADEVDEFNEIWQEHQSN